MLNHSKKEKDISSVHLNKFYLDKIIDTQTHITKQPNEDEPIQRKIPIHPQSKSILIAHPQSFLPIRRLISLRKNI